MNVFAFCRLIDEGIHIWYDSRKADIFFVQLLGIEEVMTFRRAKVGLYFHNISDKYIEKIAEWMANKTIKNNTYNNVMQVNMQYQGITTVAKNRQNYSSQQFKRAKEAHKLYHNVGAPTAEKFKLIL